MTNFRADAREVAGGLMSFLLAAAFLCVGLLCLIVPSKVTDFQRDHGLLFPWFDPFQETKSGQIVTRLLGLIFTVVGGVILYALIENDITSK